MQAAFRTQVVAVPAVSVYGQAFPVLAMSLLWGCLAQGRAAALRGVAVALPALSDSTKLSISFFPSCFLH